MKHLLLSALLLVGLAAGCKEEETAPTPITPQPLGVPVGQWQLDRLTSEHVGNRSAANVILVSTDGHVHVQPANNGKENYIYVRPGTLIGSSTAFNLSGASTPCEFILPVLSHGWQLQGPGRTDSIIKYTATSFVWRHYGGWDNDAASANNVLTGYFHKVQ